MSGDVNALTDYVVFMSLTRIFSVPLGRVWIAKLLSGGLAIAVNFLLNRNWVFGSPDARRSGQVARFLIAAISASWGIQLALTQFSPSVWPAPGLTGYALLSRFGLPAFAPGIHAEAAALKTMAFGLATSGC